MLSKEEGFIIFKRKQELSNLDSVHLWPGIYKFELPYLTGHNVRDNDGLVKVSNCDVEMHIGDQNNLDQHLIATVIISAKKGGVGTTNFIEHIATLIKTGYIDQVVLPKYGAIYDRIRWVERNYYPDEIYQVVSLEWNSELNHYSNPKWINLENDWILKENKLKPYD
ncbi:hypothetical protein [Sporosarcina psychrophila]|uniref:Uncharacterized protein n=1 Tax=Sporosarcina psychrophila TaxID=1476 RepID=A0ABV2KCL7_SPOPS